MKMGVGMDMCTGMDISITHLIPVPCKTHTPHTHNIPAPRFLQKGFSKNGLTYYSPSVGHKY